MNNIKQIYINEEIFNRSLGIIHFVITDKNDHENLMYFNFSLKKFYAGSVSSCDWPPKIAFCPHCKITYLDENQLAEIISFYHLGNKKAVLDYLIFTFSDLVKVKKSSLDNE